MPSNVDAKSLIGNAEAFPILANWDFFNHAAVAPIPHAAAEAMRAYAAESERGAYLETQWYQTLELLRNGSASLINAHRDEIALVKNTSEGLSIVANGIDWKPGDRIVTTNVVYPANMYPWMEVQRKFGAQLVAVPEETAEDGALRVPLDKILDAASAPGTRLLTLSHIEYASGQRHDIARIGAFCRERGILFCVDAIQTMGVLPLDVRAMNIDYLSADGHKWLLGPEGAGIFFIRKELLESTRPSQIGWLNVINPLEYGKYDFTLKPDAGRYESGTYNVPGFLGLRASLNLLRGVGIPFIAQRIKALTDRLVKGLVAKGYQICSPRGEDEWSGIVTFTSPSQNHAELFRALRKNHRTEIALREGRLRASPHFYNTEEQIDRLIEHL